MSGWVGAGRSNAVLASPLPPLTLNLTHPSATSTHLPPSQIVDDGGEAVEAQDVVKQAGGIAGGADGPRATFAAGVQFSITDPAWGHGGGAPKVGVLGCAGWKWVGPLVGV